MMAGVANNCQVSSNGDDTCDAGNDDVTLPHTETSPSSLKNANTSDVSLQELIENELALRNTSTNDITYPCSLSTAETDDNHQNAQELPTEDTVATSDHHTPENNVAHVGTSQIASEENDATSEYRTSKNIVDHVGTSQMTSEENANNEQETVDCSKITITACDSLDLSSPDEEVRKIRNELLLHVEGRYENPRRDKDWSWSEYTDTDLLTIGSSPESDLEADCPPFEEIIGQTISPTDESPVFTPPFGEISAQTISSTDESPVFTDDIGTFSEAVDNLIHVDSPLTNYTAPNQDNIPSHAVAVDLLTPNLNNEFCDTNKCDVSFIHDELMEHPPVTVDVQEDNDNEEKSPVNILSENLDKKLSMDDFKGFDVGSSSSTSRAEVENMTCLSTPSDLIDNRDVPYIDSSLEENRGVIHSYSTEFCLKFDTDKSSKFYAVPNNNNNSDSFGTDLLSPKTQDDYSLISEESVGEYYENKISDSERQNNHFARTDYMDVKKKFENYSDSPADSLYYSAKSDFSPVEDVQNDVGCEGSPAEKKSVKKKKSSTEETASTTRVKKTKKSEEKENISVKLNGVSHIAPHLSVDEEDDLSNVCVRELRRSFGDLREANLSEANSCKNFTALAMKFTENAALQEGSSEVQKSSFGKFDQLTKKTLLHVRSSDSTKAQQHFSQNDIASDGTLCKACNKPVFVMEQINAERHVWHKNCFRCKTCNKQLTVDIYSSHEGELYCKPHFRDLFKPKVIIDDDEPASDKPDLGLEELSSLNVRSRFELFEKGPAEEQAGKSPVSVKRSMSILSKLAKFQSKGMDVGVSSDIFDGIDYEESSSSEEELDERDITKCKTVREKPIAFNKMEDVKKTWENGQTARKEAHREECKQELQNIRSRIFMGKQGKMKEAYQQAVAESERGSSKPDIEITSSENARSIKERFERGDVVHSDDENESNKNKSGVEDDSDVFEAGISKKSRTIFQQLDADASKSQTTTTSVSSQNRPRSIKEAITRQVSNDVIRASDPVAEVAIETADISSKFKFFETYKPPEVTRKTFRITPPREGQLKSESPDREVTKNPDVVRSEDIIDESELMKSQTTAKMLSFFRQMEETHESVPDGPRPLKKFTPPPTPSSSEGESEEESEEPSEASTHDDIVRASYKVEDEFLKQAQKAAKAKALKEKFEHWEPEKHSANNAIDMLDGEQASIDSTKSLRARFESLNADSPVEKPRPKVNRFVENVSSGSNCETCQKIVYPLEKVEAGGKIFHKNCFKCSRCHCVLRMETFTMNNGQLYCIPHFKQLFISKGNYDEAFGANEHKKKWNSVPPPAVTTALKLTNGSN